MVRQRTTLMNSNIKSSTGPDSRVNLAKIVLVVLGFAAVQGCAYFNPKCQQPSEADSGMGPPRGGYIAGGGWAEAVVSGLRAATGD